jgi:hypothetical protein
MEHVKEAAIIAGLSSAFAVGMGIALFAVVAATAS